MIKPKNAERDGRKPPKPPAVSLPAPVPPLFRKIDWLAMAITFGVVWTVYLLTLAPELTLEDSGELVTGAFYAGIPHPPGLDVVRLRNIDDIIAIDKVNRLKPAIAVTFEIGNEFGNALLCDPKLGRNYSLP